VTPSQQLRRWYNYYNKKYFNSELPTDITLRWELCHEDAADTFVGNERAIQISVDPGLINFSCYAQAALLHEMIHVKYPRFLHGKEFKAELKRLMDDGAFDKLL